MDTTVDAPLEWVESITMLRLPEHADRRLQDLMDRNNEGALTDQERGCLLLNRYRCLRTRPQLIKFDGSESNPAGKYKRNSSSKNIVKPSRCLLGDEWF